MKINNSTFLLTLVHVFTHQFHILMSCKKKDFAIIFKLDQHLFKQLFMDFEFKISDKDVNDMGISLVRVVCRAYKRPKIMLGVFYSMLSTTRVNLITSHTLTNSPKWM